MVGKKTQEVKHASWSKSNHKRDGQEPYSASPCCILSHMNNLCQVKSTARPFSRKQYPKPETITIMVNLLKIDGTAQSRHKLY